MHRLPFRADAFEDERHTSRCGIRLAVEGLRLRPETSDDGAVAAEHGHMPIAHVELDVFALRE